MGSENSWMKATIAELASEEPYSTQIGPFGNKIKSKIYTATGAPVLRGTQVNTDSRYHDGDYVFVSEDYAEDELGKFVCKADDIILCHKGTLGKIGIVPRKSRYERYIMGNSMMKVRCNREKVEPLYLYYWLCSHAGQHHIFSNVSQTGVPQIQRPLSTLREALVSLPTMADQKSIAHILGSLDDKIELNREMNVTLESMARALFKSWFVDFDPVIDKALAAGNPIPEPLSARAQTRRALAGQTKPLPDHIQKLFPDAFQFDEDMGWIPDGWEVEAVYDVADFINGASFKSEHFCSKEDGLPVVKIAELKNGLTAQTKFTDRDLDEKYSIDDREILFSWSGSPDTSIDTFIWSGGRGWLNQHVFKVSLHEPSDRSFVYCLLKYLKPVFVEIARDKQTTGLGHVTAKDMKRLHVLKPPHGLLAEFDAFVKPILARGFETVMQGHRVGKLRDTLLPQLLSGSLRVPDAEQLVADSL